MGIDTAWEFDVPVIAYFDRKPFNSAELSMLKTGAWISSRKNRAGACFHGDIDVAVD